MMGGGVGLGKDIAAGMSNLVGETARGFFFIFFIYFYLRFIIKHINVYNYISN